MTTTPTTTTTTTSDNPSDWHHYDYYHHLLTTNGLVTAGAITGIVLGTLAFFVICGLIVSSGDEDVEDGLGAYVCGCLAFWLIIALPILATQLDECTSTMSSPNSGNSGTLSPSI